MKLLLEDKDTKISDKLKDFIIDNKDLLNENKFYEFYDKAYDYFYNRSDSLHISGRWIGQLSSILLKAGIDPLHYLDHIPESFLYDSDITSFKIPNHIINIEPYAFTGCKKLTNIELSQGLKYIQTGAFENCSSLTKIILPASISFVAPGAFEDCDKLIVFYDGTEEDWNRLKSSSQIFVEQKVEFLRK